MSAIVDLEVLVNSQAWLEALPRAQAICRRAVEAAFAVIRFTVDQAEMSVVLTDDDSIRALNRAWLARDAPTNVLAFPASAAGERPAPGHPLLLGDVVVAFETAAAEAAREGKLLEHHLSHLVVHGTMHLLGYDHGSPQEADAMERLEVTALAGLGIPDPYAEPGVEQQ